MYINTKRQVVEDAEEYVSSNGTRYPRGFPKSEIGELSAVEETLQPAYTDYQRVSYEIDEDNIQVWHVSDMTEAERILKKKSLVPYSVTMRQACLVLEKHEYLETVEETIAAMPKAARIEWARSKDVLRTQPLVLLLAQLLGLSEDELDDLFIEAKTL